MDILFKTIGWIATAITILVFIPQTYKVVKTRDVRTLSKITFPILTLGACIWVVYGSMMKQWEVASANGVVAALMSIIIFYLFKDRTKNDDLARVGLWIMIYGSIALMPVFAFVNIGDSIVLKYILVIIAGLCAGFGFMPQAFKIIKDRKLESFSFWTGFLIMLCDGLWSVYFAHELTNSFGNDVALNSISLTVALLSSGTQIPIMIIHYLSSKNEKNKALA